MEIKLRISRPTLIVILILSLVLGLTSSQAAAQPPVPPDPAAGSNELLGGAPVPGGPGFISLSPYDFLPRTQDSTNYLTYGQAFCSTSIGRNELYAPVDLPQGAVVNKLVAYFLDNNPSYNLTLGLKMHPLLSNEEYPLTSLSVGANPPSFTYNAIATTAIDPLYATVNNAANSYLVYLDLPLITNGSGALCLTGVRVDYGYPTSLPVISR